MSIAQRSPWLERPAQRLWREWGDAATFRAWFGAWSRRTNAGTGGSGVWRTAFESLLFPLAGVAATTALLLAITTYSAFKFEPIVFLIPVVICALRWGHVSAIVSAIASTVASDFFFIPPIYSFQINDPNQIVELVLFLFVAVVTASLAARLKNEADALRRREHEIANLYEFSRRLAVCATAQDLVAAIQEYLSVHLGCEAHLIRLAGDYDERRDASGKRAPDAIAQQALAMIAARETASQLAIETGQQNLWVLRSIATKMSDHGVLAVNLGAHGAEDASLLNERVDALLAEANATLTRIDAAAAFANANKRFESDTLRSALIGTASHELRSPVAAILGSASVLDQVPALRQDAKLRSLVDGMHREARRLDADLQNLLDTARITDTGIKPHRLWTDPADILTAAVRQRSDRIAGHKLRADIAADLPLVHIDPALMEQAAGQIIENAAKYSPAGSDITVAVRAEAGNVTLSVTDQGAGLTPEEAAEMFRRAARGRRHIGRTPGLGLGLWIARIFVTANGGTITAHSPGPERGTTVSIRLPVGAPATPSAAALSDAQTG